MLADFVTVVWKESKSLLRGRSGRMQVILSLGPLVLLAIFLPLRLGPDWAQIGLSIVPSIIFPVVLVGTTIPDAFAGERERHTLPTLLASRLPDGAILFGKVSASALFAWGVTLLVLLVSLVTINIGHWNGAVQLYTPIVAMADVSLSFLAAMLTAGAGVLFSLRASTVQQAQQALMTVLLIPPMAMALGLVAAMGSTSGKQIVKDILATLSFEQMLLIVAGALVVIAVVLSVAAMARFKRARLILS